MRNVISMASLNRTCAALALLALAASGCEVNVTTQSASSEGATTTTASASVTPAPSPSPSPAPAPTYYTPNTGNCWYGDIATNGPVSHPSDYSFYECYGPRSNGAPDAGVWIGFYGDGKSYLGTSPTHLVAPIVDDSQCKMTWIDGGTTEYATTGGVDSSGSLTQITLYLAEYGEVITYTCHNSP